MKPRTVAVIPMKTVGKPLFLRLEGDNNTAQGNALEIADEAAQALKGRQNRPHSSGMMERLGARAARISPFQGLGVCNAHIPRALPWALSLRPFGLPLGTPRMLCKGDVLACFGLPFPTQIAGMPRTPTAGASLEQAL